MSSFSGCITRIEAAISQVIEYDEKKWKEYVPLPLEFVCSPDKQRFDVDESKIEANLDFLIDQLETHEKILPPWGKSYYKGDLKPAYNEWIGVWTLKALWYLDNYGRIKK
ncbi:hypothetical protein [Kosmotoga sp. DU53]|uniref:hypothetical protein n=1 Tax=Kosmotoga sp. DU53 TaxID=1310160 RepID=UPI001372AC91|nr:hypothetical protein [Kosmotoga sp. DU53]